MNKLLQLNKQGTILLLATLAVFFSLVSFSHAVDIQEIESPGGIKAYLVEDYTLPIISMSFAFKAGSSQDPQGKTGTTYLMRSLLDEGAGDLDSQKFLAKLEDHGIEIGFSSSRDNFRGSLRTLVSEQDTATNMLALAVNSPRFDADAIERIRDSIRASIIRSQASPTSILSKTQRETLFPNSSYGRPTKGTLETIDTITRDDLIAMHDRLLTRDTLRVGVVGAINPKDLGRMLDKIFGELPQSASLTVLEDVEPVLGQEKKITMDVPNVSVAFVYKGLSRNDPDFFAAYLMNHVLGGSAFSSRLQDELREKRGLTYGASSSLATLAHSHYLRASTSTRAENEEQVLDIMRSVFKDMTEKGINQKELDRAKQYVTGAYAINNLDTSSKIAGVLVGIQLEGLGKNYINDREQQIAAVTLEQVNRVARELLSVQPTVIRVGPQASK